MKPQFTRQGLAPLALLIAISVAANCLAAEPQTQPPSSADKLPPVSGLPSRPELPDPLVMFDGRRVTTREQWVHERRPELVALFQHYMYGASPPVPREVSGKIERQDRTALGGKATLKEVTVRFGPPELPPIHLMLLVPNQRPGPAPVVLSMNYFGNHTLVRDPAVSLSTNWMPERGAGVVNYRATEASRGTWVDIWRVEYLIERGYAVATFYNGDIDPDRPEGRGIQTHFRKLDAKHDCGTIAAWAWGLSRAVDYLVTAPDLDKNRIVVTGHSRLGKAALLAAAFDERIALAIPHQAGCGGSAPSRTAIKPAGTAGSAPSRMAVKQPETVKQINDKFPHWFSARFKEFNEQPDRLPFDQHCLVALCAPRPVLFTNGRDDTWINPGGQFEVMRAAAPVYRLLGAGDFTPTELPPDGKLVDGTLGFFLRPGAHSLKPEDWKAFLDFADKHLGVPAKPRSASKWIEPGDERLEAAFKLIREAVGKGEVPGALALVARHGRILRSEALGFSDPERQVPFRTNALCWIASVTKPVTVAAAMTLVDEGKLSLDEPVEKYLPEFRAQTDTNGVHHVITIRHLMTHTSGLVSDPPTRGRGNWAIGGALDDSWLTAKLPEIVRAIARSRLLFKPGSRVRYSNAAPFVLGRLMEVVSGKPYAQLVKERILAPLGMNDTWYAPPASEAGRVAAIFAERPGQRSAIFRFNPELKISNPAPDGGLFSYPAELVKFLQMFLDNDGKVLSQAAVREMLKEQFPGWGLGWALEDGCFAHAGSSGTSAFADPKNGAIGILFFQFRDQKGRTSELAKEFRQQVRAAFAPPVAGAASR